ncbi:Bacterial dynamin-like protein [Polaromonas vacuolata]|uniref:Bacterial dynamin-like protein n=1 Tax=Polaromonas vacuolata TaxID=37448 RepID=A0A6H2HC68_9BURK|nr:dynamin family protein [Polaromonas vacuolata]QJC57393.1 Bacterial dynamin-like protein [Polaromonas vacuolata]
MSFNQRFDQHSAWRRDFALRLKLLVEWMKSHDLLDAAVESRLSRLESQVRSDKIMVAFVAEFSRGKSELINAIFFAGYGRRIMPASAGRTTMCPTELAWNADLPACLRLLPIDTRLKSQFLMDWRDQPDQWVCIDLDVNDPAQLAKALEKVADVSRVSIEQARALGFWNDTQPEDNPLPDADSLVEVPKWRHALINIAHPLLKQGLVILDTPGLNAIGAEPELTVSLIPQAQAVVFILGVDTGVTKSDLSIWREHLATDDDQSISRLVVLNKIDMLWDALSSPEQVAAQIDKQVVISAEILGLPKSRLTAVSAQKGLVAKITRNRELLAASGLPELERMLADEIMGQRQNILQVTVANAISELRAEAGRVIHVRHRDLAEQADELRGLSGKNVSVVKLMRSRILQEQLEFDESGLRIQATRSVHLKLLRSLLVLLGSTRLKTELVEFKLALKQPGIKFGLKKAYKNTFIRLRESLDQAGAQSAEIYAMLAAAFRQVNSEFGFSLQAPKAPELARYRQDLDSIERSHLQYLGVGKVIKLTQADFSERLMLALATRLRIVFEQALNDVELWNKSAASQLDTQLRERRRNFGRRLEAIERIQDATSGLDERIADIAVQELALKNLNVKLIELTAKLTDTPLLSRAVFSQSEPDSAKRVLAAAELA